MRWVNYLDLTALHQGAMELLPGSLRIGAGLERDEAKALREGEEKEGWKEKGEREKRRGRVAQR